MKIDVVIAFLLGLVLGLVLRRFVSSADPVSEAPKVATTPPKAIFYADCDMKGASVELSAGKYSNSTAIGLKNDSISSIKVPKGLKVAIYEDNDFKGAVKEWVAKDGDMYIKCLTNEKINTTKNWNDRISSIKITAL